MTPSYFEGVQPPPAATPALALADAKAWMRVELDEEDAVIAALIAAATASCEAFIGQLLIARGVTEILPIQTGNWQRLGFGPVRALTSVEGVPADGAPFAFPVEHYGIDVDATGEGWVRVTQPGAAGRMRVTYMAGLAEQADALPPDVRQGLLRLVAHLYAARDDARDAVPPDAVTRLWQPWRRPVL